jgi:glycosyltransferase involved in cell wall biosynthesis
MHILFVHQNFPAQFGDIADHLTRRLGFRCTFVSQRPSGQAGGVERIQYHLRGGATAQTHYCSRTFENTIWHTRAAYEALKVRPDIRPDLIVGHSGFVSTLFLRELYPDTPTINYFEHFYRSRHSDMDFRPDFPADELVRLRSYARNAMLLLDLENWDAGYGPTCWQRDRLPALFHGRVYVIFDGIDTDLWRPRPGLPRRLDGREIPADRKLVRYAARGMESMRGFDIFMKFARRLARHRPDVLFVIAGEDRVCYGGDQAVTGGKTFKEWVLAQDDYDLSRFLFLGLVPPPTLAGLFNLTDLHVYLTVPFVLSWSLMDALACGAVVLASDTAPVREMIGDGENGLLVDFFDVDRMVEIAAHVLDHPGEYHHLGEAGARLIRERYSLDVCLPQMLALYEDVVRCNRETRTDEAPDRPRI